MAHKPSVLYPDHRMYTDAVEAMRQYHEAQASGSPAEQVERLRQIAESQFQALNEYQLEALGCGARQPH